MKEDAQHGRESNDAHRKRTRANPFPGAADDWCRRSEKKSADQEAAPQPMNARQIPGGVDRLVAVPFDDEGHEAEVKCAARGREQESADVAVGHVDRPARL